MASRSEAFACKKFAEYYDTCSIDVPSSLEQRELGLLTFEGRRMLRHLGFKTASDFQALLQRVVPSDVYYSCAYYENPEAEMDRKGWLGADLVFDIDADHIPTPCGKVHDEWTCGNCVFSGKGVVPEKCPVCGGEKFETRTWPCERCLASAKEETVKLLEMLMHDFGFSEKEVRVFFSGHRGYHVHVESELIRTLDAVARKEIVDYVLGLGLDIPMGGFKAQDSGATQRQSSGSEYFGWLKRIISGTGDFIQQASEQDLASIGIGRKEIRALLSKRDVVLRSWIKLGNLSAVRGIGSETLRKMIEYSVKTQAAKIDTVVTTDIHRLIRLTGTLHGKTGFKKVEFPVAHIRDFEPLKSAVVFKNGTVTVLVSYAPEFRVADEVFGPYKDQEVELPTAAAMLLICKGRAEVARYDV